MRKAAVFLPFLLASSFALGAGPMVTGPFEPPRGPLPMPEGPDPVPYLPPRTIVAFDAMYGVDGAFLEGQIRGVPGDDLPWVVQRANGSLTPDGHLIIAVHGLVFPDVESVPAELRGINDDPYFRGAVSCLTAGRDGGFVTTNVLTGPFPATDAGDAVIDAMIDLPPVCVAPVVFIVAGSELKSYAISGSGPAYDGGGGGSAGRY